MQPYVEKLTCASSRLQACHRADPLRGRQQPSHDAQMKFSSILLCDRLQNEKNGHLSATGRLQPHPAVAHLHKAHIGRRDVSVVLWGWAADLRHRLCRWQLCGDKDATFARKSVHAMCHETTWQQLDSLSREQRWWVIPQISDHAPHSGHRSKACC